MHDEIPAPEPRGFFQRHAFLLRRLHSLTGLVPVGVFLCIHLITNASILWGALDTRRDGAFAERGIAAYQHEVGFINDLPALIAIEVVGLWLPLAYHSILGFYYAATGSSNTRHYGWAANYRYRLQRISGYIGILFIFYHVATLRWGWTWLPFSSEFHADHAASTTAIALRGGVEEIGLGAAVISTFYLVGVSLLVFHFANGLWTAAITWGLTISRGAQRRWGYICAGIGAVLMVAAWAAVIGFLILDVPTAEKVEQRLGSHRDAGLVLQPAEAPATAAAPAQPRSAGAHRQ